jgi:hypothetical protein
MMFLLLQCEEFATDQSSLEAVILKEVMNQGNIINLTLPITYKAAALTEFRVALKFQ